MFDTFDGSLFEDPICSQPASMTPCSMTPCSMIPCSKMFDSFDESLFEDPICKKCPKVLYDFPDMFPNGLVTFVCPVTGDMAMISEDYVRALKVEAEEAKAEALKVEAEEAKAKVEARVRGLRSLLLEVEAEEDR